MAAGQSPRREPAPLERAVPGDRLQGVLGARWVEATAGRQHRREDDLVAADQSGEEASRDGAQGRHGSPGPQRQLPPAEQLPVQLGKVRAVGLATCADHEVGRGLVRLDFPAPDFPQTAPQTIAGHRGGLELGNDQSHPRMAHQVVGPDHVQVLEAATPARGEAAANVGRACEPMGSRQARRGRQEPPCFEGSETVSRFRPFFRRRESTARPQRVAMRARNPCVLIRRLLRGRYDGFIGRPLQSEPVKLVRRMGESKVDGRDGAR